MDSVNILVTGAGAPGAAGIIHCLRADSRLIIYSADKNPDASGKLISDKFFVIPSANDPDFISRILDICISEKIKVVLPLVTKELLLFAQSINAFRENGIEVLVSSEHSLEIANDKGALYTFLQSKEIKVPQFKIVNSISEFEEATKKLGFPQIPVCFKPCKANGSRGFRIIHPHPDELKLLFEEKPSHTYVGYAEIIRILSSGEWPPLLVSEYLPGDEYSIDCLILPNQAPLILPRRRDRIQQGISTAGTFVNDSAIINYCLAIIEACELTGNIGIQVKISAKGEPLILEINPRVQGTISSALGAGVNFPLLAVLNALGEIPELNKISIRWGTRFVRVWKELFYD